ncbi:MAG: Gfo/Idh/MocA family oxidoreductase [Planctomycetaceae bacterium]|nr:Gfo/Idh/MocA family oxidoreductase [Planctomycetaceae bacterium]
MSKIYRVGVIGDTGRGNYGHGVDTAIASMPQTNVVAVADPHDQGRDEAQKRTGAAQAYANYRDMLQKEQLDIVAICPRWIDQHHDMILACAHAGCHIYMEKPFCRNLVESDEAIRELEMRHLKLGIAHISQYSPVLATMLKLIENDEIGEVLEVRGRGKEDRRGGGEDLWVLGSHVFGLMRSFAGGNAVSCTATAKQEGHLVTKADVKEGAEGIGPLAADHVEARYEFDSGVTGHFASRKDMGGNPSRFAVQVFGSKGVMELASGYMVPGHILKDSSWSPGRTGKQWQPVTSAGIDQPEPITKRSYHDGHVAAIEDLIACIENDDRQPKCSQYDARAITEMIAAVFESHRQGGPVGLPLDLRENPLTKLS